MKLHAFLFLILAGIFSENSAYGLSLRLHTAFLPRGNKLGIAALTADEPGGCELSLYASFIRRDVSSRAPRARIISASDKRLFSVSGIKPLSRSTRLHIGGFLDCGDSETASAIRSTPVPGVSSGRGSQTALLRTLHNRIKGSTLELTEPFPNVSVDSPVDFQFIPGTDSIFIVSQNGIIYRIANGDRQTYLDISELVLANGEQGLLGLAFHPQFKKNGRFFVHYSAAGTGDTVVARYNGTATLGDSSSGTVILTQTQPFSNHNGGGLVFGPDGYLYLGLGDGGSGGDPLGNGQNLTTILGKILRFDVNRSSGGRSYSIPKSNPFRGNSSGFREEIFAYGFRNPWRFSFDRETGKLWAGDVGQNTFEEVDVVRRGQNYGWNTMEGFHCFSPSEGCNQSGLALPVTEYDHSMDNQSVTGGAVYRGTANPALYGLYIFGDFASGRIYAVDAASPAAVPSEILDSDELISSFGVDRRGEIYLLSYGSGKILRLSL